MSMNLGKLQEVVRTGSPGVLQSMGLQQVRHDWATEQQQLQQEGVKRNQGSLTHSLRGWAWGGLGVGRGL